MKIVPNKRQNPFYCAIKLFIFIKNWIVFGSAAISLLIIVYCTYMRATAISQHNAYGRSYMCEGLFIILADMTKQNGQPLSKHWI